MISLSKIFEPSPTIQRGAFVISLVTALGSLLGIVKNALLGARFGASTELDLYFAAFRIPDFLYNIFIFSTLSSSFLPVFSDLIAQGKERLWGLLSSAMLVFTLLLAVCAGFVLIFADNIVGILAPGFSTLDLERLALLTRVLMVQPIILAISNLIAMTLQGFKRFFISSCAPIFYNAGIIFGVVIMARWWGMMGVVYGVVIGALLHLLVQLPSLNRLGFRFSVAVKESWGSLKEMFFLMVPRSLALLANNIITLWVVSVSSLLAPGSLAVFDLANTIQGLPQTVFALSLITASFPFLSSSWVTARDSGDQGARNDFWRLFGKTGADLFTVMIPVAMLMAVFAPAIVRILLGYGNFSETAQAATGLTLVFFAIGLPFQAFLMFLVRVFFAMKNTRIPLYSALAVTAMIIPLIWVLGSRFNSPGIALAMSAGSFANVLLLWLMLKRQSGGQRFPVMTLGIRRGFLLGLFASVPSGIAYYSMNLLLKGATTWIFIFQIMVAAIIGFVSVFAALYVLKIASIRDFGLDKVTTFLGHESE